MSAVIILGDSWARSEDAYIDTWAELLARPPHAPDGGRRRCLNFACAHSGSAELKRQLYRLFKTLEQAEEEGLQDDALAIIHTGGNDLYFSSPVQLVAVAASGVLQTGFARLMLGLVALRCVWLGLVLGAHGAALRFLSLAAALCAILWGSLRRPTLVGSLRAGLLHATRELHEVGVRRFVLSGLPLSIRMPFIADPLSASPACSRRQSGSVVRMR